MMQYLDAFQYSLERRWKGRLVSVREATRIEPNAKEYLRTLVARESIEKVTWGWYWIPDAYRDVFEFLAKQRHVTVVQKQTAAAVWNSDFVHRDQYRIAVTDHSYGRALQAFRTQRGWNITVETRQFQRDEYTKVGNLSVTSLETTIIDCIKEWAFADAFAAVYENRDTIKWQRLARHTWERIPRTSTRVGQVLAYGTALLKAATTHAPLSTLSAISDPFVRGQVEEAAHQVAALA